MSLTRKMLKAMGIEDDKIDQIIEAHTETVDALKEERDSYKKDASKLAEIQRENEELKQRVDDPYKEKYEKEHDEFEKYKADIAAKETISKKKNAYRDLLKEAGVSDKRLDSILKVTDLTGVELDDTGKLKEKSKHLKSIKEEWADFVTKEGAEGADTETPPGTGSGKMTKEEIMKISDASERQAAIAENHDLFGF